MSIPELFFDIFLLTQFPLLFFDLRKFSIYREKIETKTKENYGHYNYDYKKFTFNEHIFIFLS